MAAHSAFSELPALPDAVPAAPIVFAESSAPRQEPAVPPIKTPVEGVRARLHTHRAPTKGYDLKGPLNMAIVPIEMNMAIVPVEATR
jgi:hypothetical protein